MTLHADLLAQASDLANKERKKPKQASLRRAVSATYYAMFHFLIHEACGFLVSGGGADAKKIRSTLARAFTHTQMRATSQAFVQNAQNPWARMFATPPADLITIARTFVDLQQARHEADYDLGRRWARSEVQALIVRAQQAVASWSATSSHGAARAYLVGILVQTKHPS